MVTSVDIYVRGTTGQVIIITLSVGKAGVSKIFTAKEDPGTLVVLMKDNILTYSGFPFICEKEYKEKED